MANKGEFRLIDKTPFQKVESISRTNGVMFSPSSSRSRLRIVDSGKRYEIRLNSKGMVEYRIDGENWKLITPCIERSIFNIKFPQFISYNKKREGEFLEDIRFDMIAVGRGRIIAKQVGTDQIFHLVMDELFRTYNFKQDLLINHDLFKDSDDKPVPASYFKLDPEFFQTVTPSNKYPSELDLYYNDHPASSRFKIYKELLDAKIIDAMYVIQRPRVWYLVDTRSPLMITGPEDLKIDEDDFKDIFTLKRIREIYFAFLKQFRNEKFDELVVEEIFVAIENSWNEYLDDSLISDLRRGIRDILTSLIPNWIVRALRRIDNFFRNLAIDVAQWFWDNFLKDLAKELSNPLLEAIAKSQAKTTKKEIEEEGFGAILIPANLFVIALMSKFREGDPGERAFDTINNKFSINPKKFFNVLRSSSNSDNEELLDGINKLIRRSRKRYYRLNYNIYDSEVLSKLSKVPNMPPLDIPIFHHTTYEKRDESWKEKRYGIAFSKVLDLGVGYSHWSEHLQLDFGGEINSLLSTRPMTQQEQYSLLQYRLLNGPVIDGDGFNDGTCNFYMLVRLKDERLPIQQFPLSKNRKSKLDQKYAILFVDEQSYFSQRWRLVHPTDDVLGDIFSIERFLKDNPEWFKFDINNFWEPFQEDLINDNSRMVVKRQIIILTGYNTDQKRHEIYSICFSFGVCDFTWRWRIFPQDTVQSIIENTFLENPDQPLPQPSNDLISDYKINGIVYVNAIDLREDTNIVVKGFKFIDNNGRKAIEGRWFQKYLPANLYHIPHRIQLSAGQKPQKGYNHEWEFVSEVSYRCADKYYSLGIFNEEINSRCQYYEIEILPTKHYPEEILASQNFIDNVSSKIWVNNMRCGKDKLYFNTVNFNWSIQKEEDGYVPLTSIFRNQGMKPTISMYEEKTRFKILYRKPFGLIAIFYDKRDDELQSASHLPQETFLCEEKIHIPVNDLADCGNKKLNKPVNEPEIPVEFEIERPLDLEKDNLTELYYKKSIEFEYEKPGMIPVDPDLKLEEPTFNPDEEIKKEDQIRVLFKKNVRVISPPIVTKVRLKKSVIGGNPCLVISFWTPQNETEVNQNIWKVNIAALENSVPIQILEIETFSNFIREKDPDNPLPFQFTGRLDSNYRYDYEWFYAPSDLLKIDKYCTTKGRIDYFTSVWFEDIVGHKTTSQTIEFN